MLPVKAPEDEDILVGAILNGVDEDLTINFFIKWF